MKNQLMGIILSVLVMVGPAWSIISPEPDLMGLYFDTEADDFCVDGVAAFSNLTLYLIYTNPTPEAIWAFRAGIELPDLVVVTSVFSPCDPIVLDGTISFECGWSTLEPTVPAMVLVSLELLYMDANMAPAYFFLGSMDDPLDGVPSVMLSDQTWMDTGLLFGDGPVAMVNGDCSVSSVEFSTFDALKALYR